MSASFLPTSLDEIRRLGWEQPDVILFSGDAYVDHPSFGAAVIGRVLEAQGYKVALVPQPNWRDDLRDFRKLGRPRLFFGVSPGAMDSMVNHYTAARRLRHDDAYTAGGRHGQRPDYPGIVYTRILKELFPDVPVALGGIEASLRRVAHYDYWQDRLRPPYLLDATADILIYGMGERPVTELARRLDQGEKISDITDIAQTAFIAPSGPVNGSPDIVLSSYEACLKDKRKQAANFKIVEVESNRMHGHVMWQQAQGKWIRINPMLPPMTSAELDAIYDLPNTLDGKTELRDLEGGHKYAIRWTLEGTGTSRRDLKIQCLMVADDFAQSSLGSIDWTASEVVTRYFPATGAIEAYFHQHINSQYRTLDVCRPMPFGTWTAQLNTYPTPVNPTYWSVTYVNIVDAGKTYEGAYWCADEYNSTKKLMFRFRDNQGKFGSAQQYSLFGASEQPAQNAFAVRCVVAD